MPLRNLIAAIHPRLAVVLHDMLMVWIAWTAVSMLRWSLAPNPPPLALFGPEVWFVLAAQGVIFWWTGLYKGLWRFASLPDLWNIAKAAVLGALAIAITLFLYNRLETVPRTVLTVYPLVLAVLLGAPRLLYRYWKDSRLDSSARAPSQRVLVLGAGKAGEALVRDLRRENRYTPVGFLDDNAHLRGGRVHGVPVLGTLDQLPQLARETAAEMLVIAMPTASKAQMRRAVDLCESCNLPFRTVPRLRRRRRRPRELQRAQGSRDRGLARPRSGAARLDRDPHAARGKARTGHRRRRIDRIGTVPPGRAPGRRIADRARLSEYNLYAIEQELRGEHPDLLFNARARRLRRRRGVRAPVRDDATADRVPCGGVQARAAAAGAAARGVPQQRARHRDRRRGGRSARRRQLRADLDRQGGQSDQRHGRVQARRRALLPELREPIAHAFHHGAVRQRARFGRLASCRSSASRSARAVR